MRMQLGPDGTSVGSDDGVEDFIPIPDPVTVMFWKTCRSILSCMLIIMGPLSVVLGDVVEVETLVPLSPHSPLAISYILAKPGLVSE